MRKGSPYPRTLGEAKERIEEAQAQIERHRILASLGPPDRVDPYHIPKRFALDAHSLRPLQKEANRARRMLSERVRRFYRRNGRISLVCALLRYSPVFLRDRWVNEVFIVKKRAATFGPDRQTRTRALKDLRELSEALVTERVPAGPLRKKRKWQCLDSERPLPSTHEMFSLSVQYDAFLEMAMCMREAWSLAGKKRRSPKTEVENEARQSQLAETLKVPVEWLRECRKGATKPHLWALRQVAENHGTTLDAIRGRLKRRGSQRAESIKVIQRILDARQRLAPERERRARERSKKGEPIIPRRY